MVQHYFASAWIPSDKFARDIYAGRIDNGLYRIGMQTPLGVVAQGSTVVEKALIQYLKVGYLAKKKIVEPLP